MMKEQTQIVMIVVAIANLALLAVATPVKASVARPSSDDAATMRALYESNEESLNRFMNDPSYRAGYERAVFDLYAGRFQEIFSSGENVYPTPAKKAIDLGLGRFNSGSRAASSLLALDSANFAGGPGRK